MNKIFGFRGIQGLNEFFFKLNNQWVYLTKRLQALFCDGNFNFSAIDGAGLSVNQAFLQEFFNQAGGVAHPGYHAILNVTHVGWLTFATS